MADPHGNVLMLNSEGCGTADPDLGYEIMMQLLQALPDREDRPKTIIFWNTAVKLLVNGSPALPHLRRLEGKGVQIMAGKLCVTELELTDKIAVGRVVSLPDILDVILHHDIVSL